MIAALLIVATFIFLADARAQPQLITHDKRDCTKVNYCMNGEPLIRDFVMPMRPLGGSYVRP